MSTACSTKVTAIKGEIIPPYDLVIEAQIPEFIGTTNGDLLIYTRELQGIIEKQNIDKRTLKIWLKTL